MGPPRRRASFTRCFTLGVQVAFPRECLVDSVFWLAEARRRAARFGTIRLTGGGSARSGEGVRARLNSSSNCSLAAACRSSAAITAASVASSSAICLNCSTSATAAIRRGRTPHSLPTTIILASAAFRFSSRRCAASALTALEAAALAAARKSRRSWGVADLRAETASPRKEYRPVGTVATPPHLGHDCVKLVTTMSVQSSNRMPPARDVWPQLPQIAGRNILTS